MMAGGASFGAEAMGRFRHATRRLATVRNTCARLETQRAQKTRELHVGVGAVARIKQVPLA